MRVPLSVSPGVPVHVPVSGERLAANVAGKRALARVDQHVAVERRKRGEHLAAQAAIVDLLLTRGVVGVVLGLDLIVAPDVSGELSLVWQDLWAKWALVVVRDR